MNRGRTTSGRLLAVGDSITVSCWPGFTNSGQQQLSWAEQLAGSLGWGLERVAIRGATSHAIRAELDSRRLDSRFDLGLVYVGVNNVCSASNWERYDLEEDVRYLLRVLQSLCDQVAVLGFPECLGVGPTLFPYGPGQRRRTRAANEVVRRVAAEVGAMFVPAPDIRRRSEVWVDGIHPTSEGHRLMAERVLAVLGWPSDVGDRCTAPPNDPAYRGWRVTRATRFVFKRPLLGTANWVLAVAKRGS